MLGNNKGEEERESKWEKVCVWDTDRDRER
jgi:hypothetical protein